MPPLLIRLSERKPETLDYLGVSYGLTPQLLRQFRFLLTTACSNGDFLVQVLEESGLRPVVYAPDNERTHW
jgi:hypothetical protein